MHIEVINERKPALIENLLSVWENSVKVSHLFLSADEIAHIKNYVPQALNNVSVLAVLFDRHQPVGFMGINAQKLEMLFLDPSYFGKGLGKLLLQYGISHYDINEVTVNEQNPMATAFYQRMGFAVYQRTELDEQGQAYPLLYMKLNQRENNARTQC